MNKRLHTRVPLLGGLIFSLAALPLRAQLPQTIRQLKAFGGVKSVDFDIPSIGAGTVIPAHHVDGSIHNDTNPQMAHLVEVSRPAVVMIDASSTRGGFGSGFFIHPEGLIATNAHVVKSAGEGGLVEIMLMDRTVEYGKVAAYNEKRDIAFIWINPNSPLSKKGRWPTLEIADEDSLQPGHLVVAIGAPFGLDQTVTVGHVSAVNRAKGDLVRFNQTDASINPGNSGGPLLDIQGKVVGINTQIYTKVGESNGLGFAISIADIKGTITQYTRTGNIKSGWLGAALAAGLNFGRAEGAKVSGVMSDSPADRAGLKSEDVIIAIDGEPLPKDPTWAIKAVQMRMSAKAPGDAAVFRIRRGQDEVELTATLIEEPEKSLQSMNSEASTKGNLGAIRSALSIYYGDKEGEYPPDMSSLIPKYLTQIPTLSLPGTGHAPTNEVRILTAVKSEADLILQLQDTGKWLYVADQSGEVYGTFTIDCTHEDSKGSRWHKY